MWIMMKKVGHIPEVEPASQLWFTPAALRHGQYRGLPEGGAIRSIQMQRPCAGQAVLLSVRNTIYNTNTMNWTG